MGKFNKDKENQKEAITVFSFFVLFFTVIIYLLSYAL
jgi:hypothetical protein